MNVENIKKVRDVIVSIEKSRFNMSNWAATPYDDVPPTELAHDCETCGCIAGWTVATFYIKRVPNDTDIIIKKAGSKLGLGDQASRQLFYATGSGLPWPHVSNITQAQAASVLDRLIETGEVDWAWAMENPADLSGASS